MSAARNLSLALVTALVLALVLAILLVLQPVNRVEAVTTQQTAADFFQGKTITAIAPAGPSSTFTLLARIMEPYIEKYSGAQVIVESMQAGGGYQARNHIYNSDPDGLTLVLVGHGPKMITGSMFGLPGANYNWAGFVPLGKIVDSTYVVYVSSDSDWDVPADMREAAFNFGESTAFFGPQFAEALGWKNQNVIPGYSSSAARATAVARGEIQSTAGSLELYVAQPDAVKPMVTALPLVDFPEVPTISEAATDAGKKWAEYVEGWMGVMYMAYAPPGLPEESAAFLEEVLKKTWADPGFAEDLKKLELEPTDVFMSRARLQEYMDRLSSMSPEEIEELDYVINNKYKKQ